MLLKLTFYSQHYHCYNEDALLWPHGPWYKSVIYFDSVSTQFTQPQAETWTLVYNAILCHQLLCGIAPLLFVIDMCDSVKVVEVDHKAVDATSWHVELSGRK